MVALCTMPFIPAGATRRFQHSSKKPMSRGRRKPTLIPLAPKRRNLVREKQEKAAHQAALQQLDKLFSLLKGLTYQRRFLILAASFMLVAAATAPAGPRVWSQSWKYFAFTLGQATIVVIWMSAIRIRVRRRLRNTPINWTSIIRLERWSVTLATFYVFIASKLWVFSEDIGPKLAPVIEPYLPAIGNFVYNAVLKFADWIASAVVGTIALAILSLRISLIRKAVVQLASLDKDAAG